jgi:formate-dependent nitrite reductase membrane component NrfD
MDPGFSPQQGYRTPKNNGLAIAGFITSLLCCGPVGLGLSIAGLMQINKDPQYQLGKGFAIAGIVIGGIGIFLGIIYYIGAMAVLLDSGY